MLGRAAPGSFILSETPTPRPISRQAICDPAEQLAAGFYNPLMRFAMHGEFVWVPLVFFAKATDAVLSRTHASQRKFKVSESLRKASPACVTGTQIAGFRFANRTFLASVSRFEPDLTRRAKPPDTIRRYE